MIESRGKRQTDMTKAVEAERYATMLFQEIKMKESHNNPKVLLDVEAYSQQILNRPILELKDMKGIMEKGL